MGSCLAPNCDAKPDQRDQREQALVRINTNGLVQCRFQRRHRDQMHPKKQNKSDNKHCHDLAPDFLIVQSRLDLAIDRPIQTDDTMPVDEKLARERLNARKAELEESSAMSADDRATVALDQQSVGRLSRMDALQQQAMAQAQERARTAELQRIDQAFRLLADGEYGYACFAHLGQINPTRRELVS